MAAPMERILPKVFFLRRTCLSLFQMTSRRNMGFIGNLRRRVMGSPKEEPISEVIKMVEADEPEEVTRKMRTCIEEFRPYQPPSDQEVENTIQNILDRTYGPTENWKQLQLNNRLQKYELLTSLMEEFDHDIPNAELNEMSTVEDAVNYFKTEVRDTSSYTDMAELDLPKNLHINLEPVRFDPETDTMFDGKTAFPELKTIVTSVKYRRKYRGTEDETDPVLERPIGIARWKN